MDATLAVNIGELVLTLMYGSEECNWNRELMYCRGHEISEAYSKLK